MENPNGNQNFLGNKDEQSLGYFERNPLLFNELFEQQAGMY